MTKDSLTKDLINMNLKSTDTVIIHSSMKKIGDIDANIVIDVLMEYFKDGLLIIPTHTWGIVKEDGDKFDLSLKSNIGIIPNLFMQRENVYRSCHPTHSVCAYGSYAKEYIKGEEYSNSPCTPYGVYDRLRQRDAKVVLIGVGNERNTFIHSVEEVLNIPYRLTDKTYKFYVNDKVVLMRKHYNPKQAHISMDFVKFDKAFDMYGIQQHYKFGNASTIVSSCNGIFDIVRHIESKEVNIIIDKEEIPFDYYSDFKIKKYL